MTVTDARAVAQGTTLSAEICVIGGGPVGISVALTASRLGRTVLLLESGDVAVKDAELDALNQTDSIGYPPMGLYMDPVAVQEFSERRLGGASNHFSGFCRPWDDDDYLGAPVTKAEIDPWYTDAHNLWAQGPVNYDPVYWAGVTGSTMPPSLGPGLEFKLAQQRPTRFGSAYRNEMTASSTLQLVHHASVTNLNRDPTDERVNTATVQTLTGVTFSAAASMFVVATGGHQTPRLLLMSNDVVPAGLGNEHDQVGRYYADHLASAFAFIYLETPLAGLGLMAGKKNVATTTPDGRQTTTNILPVVDMSAAASATEGCSLHCEVTGYDIVTLARQDTGVGPEQIAELAKARGAAFQSQLIFRTFLKPTADADSRVVLNPAKVDAFGRPKVDLDWRPTTADSANRLAAMRFYQAALHQGGEGLLHNTLTWALPDGPYPGNIPAWFKIFPQGDEPNPYHECCFHAMATTRMSSDPTSGVVDRDCRVHSVDNLYLAGPSIFHAGVGYYPTLPAVAFACRLAHHLDQVLPGAGEPAGELPSPQSPRAAALGSDGAVWPAPPEPVPDLDVGAAIAGLNDRTLLDPWATLKLLHLQSGYALGATTTTTTTAAAIVAAPLVAQRVRGIGNPRAAPPAAPPALDAPEPTAFGRRHFLMLAGAGAAIVAMPVALGGCTIANPWTQIANMGQQYIDRVPAENEHTVLGNLLGGPAEASTPPALLSSRKPQIDSEYAADQVLYITGFLLSLTEWRICAWWKTRPAPTTTTTSSPG